MKLSRQEAEKIVQLYNLGDLKKIKLINDGAVNYNFEAVTDKGVFIIRVLGVKLQQWKREKLELEFKVLDYLKKSTFHYNIPCPMIAKSNKILTRLFGKNIWVYRKLDGKVAEKINVNQMKEIARAIAVYHKTISKMKLTGQRITDSWIKEKFVKMKKVRAKGRIDHLMLANVNYFEKFLRDSGYDEFRKNELVVHGDFNRSNILFKGNKLVAFIDFDNLEFAPRVRDVAYSLRRFCSIKGKYLKSREKMFLKEYEKINPLKKDEKKMIYPFMMRDNAIIFWWFYSEMKKMRERRFRYLRETIENTKRMERLK